MLFLGFSAGLPFLLVYATLSAWLRDIGVDVAAIGFVSWVGITYSIKVFWAPVVDRVRLPFLGTRLGQRRSWMLLGQIGIAAGLLSLSMADPTRALGVTIVLAFAVAFSSATQDIAIDAYRIEAVEKTRQAAMAAAYIFGYRLALLVAGAGAFYIADFRSWSAAYATMSLLMAVGIVTTLIIAEPERPISPDVRVMEARVIAFAERYAHWPAKLRAFGEWFVGAVVCPFVDFFSRNGWFALLILALIGVYRLSDITMGVMANPFYLDLGFSKTEIANVAKIFGFTMTIAGAALGGVLVARYGILRPLLLGALLVALTNLLFALMAEVGRDLGLLTVVISADNLSGGIANAVFIAYLSSLTNTAYTATQYALFSSLMTLPGKFVGGFSGVVVASHGYATFFIYAACLGIPAIVLVVLLLRLETRANPASSATADVVK